jgi:hypothetical protein
MSTMAASRSKLLVLAALLAAPAFALAETTDWSPWGWQKGQIQQWVDDDGWTQPPGGQYGCLAVQGGSSEIGTPIVGGTCGADDPATNFILTRTGELRIDPRIRGRPAPPERARGPGLEGSRPGRVPAALAQAGQGRGAGRHRRATAEAERGRADAEHPRSAVLSGAASWSAASPQQIR